MPDETEVRRQQLLDELAQLDAAPPPGVPSDPPPPPEEPPTAPEPPPDEVAPEPAPDPLAIPPGGGNDPTQDILIVRAGGDPNAPAAKSLAERVMDLEAEVQALKSR